MLVFRSNASALLVSSFDARHHCGGSSLCVCKCGGWSVTCRACRTRASSAALRRMRFRARPPRGGCARPGDRRLHHFLHAMRRPRPFKGEQGEPPLREQVCLLCWCSLRPKNPAPWHKTVLALVVPGCAFAHVAPAPEHRARHCNPSPGSLHPAAIFTSACGGDRRGCLSGLPAGDRADAFPGLSIVGEAGEQPAQLSSCR